MSTDIDELILLASVAKIRGHSLHTLYNKNIFLRVKISYSFLQEVVQ